MTATVRSATVVGVEAVPIWIEVDIARGLPQFTVVGLPDSGVRESRERVRSALRNAGYPFPLARITVNLAPSHLRKAGSSFDLPIALGILAAQGVVRRRRSQIGSSSENSPSTAASVGSRCVVHRRSPRDTGHAATPHAATG